MSAPASAPHSASQTTPSAVQLPAPHPELLVRLEAGVLTLTMNRPERRNALTAGMGMALVQAVNFGAAEPEVRAIVLTGAGAAFCAGGDVKNMAAQQRPPTPEERIQSLVVRAEASRLLATVPKPTIAILPGAAAGAGLALALSCDFRLAAAGAKLTTAFAKVGLSGDYGMSWLLTHLVGPGRARELLMFSPILTAAEARDLGLLTRVWADEQLASEAAAFVRQLAQGASVALGNIKRNVNAATTVDFAASIESEAIQQARCMTTDDHREASQAFVEKRPPAFKGR